MSRKKLTKAFMMISNWPPKFSKNIFSALRVKKIVVELSDERVNDRCLFVPG